MICDYLKPLSRKIRSNPGAFQVTDTSACFVCHGMSTELSHLCGGRSNEIKSDILKFGYSYFGFILVRK